MSQDALKFNWTWCLVSTQSSTAAARSLHEQHGGAGSRKLRQYPKHDKLKFSADFSYERLEKIRKGKPGSTHHGYFPTIITDLAVYIYIYIYELIYLMANYPCTYGIAKLWTQYNILISAVVAKISSVVARKMDLQRWAILRAGSARPAAGTGSGLIILCRGGPDAG